MNLPLAQTLAESYLTQHGLASQGWTIRFTSSKRRFGLCNYYLKRISISKYLTLANEPEEVIDTILHEIAHALAPPFSGHNSTWREICIRIGARPERCYGREVTRVHRYVANCLTCHTTYRRNRLPHQGKFNYCGNCGMQLGRLVWQANPEFENIFNLAKKPIDILELPAIHSQIEQITSSSTFQKTISQDEKERIGSKMALMLIKKSSLPVSPRGKTGSLSVAVRENGQVGFSNSAGKVFEGFTNCTIGWDQDKRIMTFHPVNPTKLPKGVTAEDLFVVGQSKDGQRYISAAGLFKFETINYDYKAAGTHSFEATVLEGGKGITFTLPTTMQPKPKQTRVRKARGASAGAGANSTSTNANSGEPVLQEA